MLHMTTTPILNSFRRIAVLCAHVFSVPFTNLASAHKPDSIAASETDCPISDGRWYDQQTSPIFDMILRITPCTFDFVIKGLPITDKVGNVKARIAPLISNLLAGSHLTTALPCAGSRVNWKISRCTSHARRATSSIQPTGSPIHRNRASFLAISTTYHTPLGSHLVSM